MKAKQKFIELSTARTGVMHNGGNGFNTDSYIKKRRLGKEKGILRKICVRLLNSPEML